MGTVAPTNVSRTLNDTILIEEFGEYVYGETVYYLTTTSNPYSDPVNAMSGAPAIGSVWGSETEVRELRAEERHMRVINTESGSHRLAVRVVYRKQREKSIKIRGGSTLQQINTAKFKTLVGQSPPTADALITVGYKGQNQNVTVDVLNPAPTAEREIVLVPDGNDPDNFVNDWVGWVNSDTWNGGGLGQWLCTSVTYEMVSKDDGRFRFRLEFEKKEQDGGWFYFAEYKQNGQVPADADFKTTPGGRLGFEWHNKRSFSGLFP